MKCGVCGSNYRKGAIIFVATSTGAMVQKRACPGCERKAIRFLPATVAPSCKCGEPATTCGVCVSKKETAAKKGGADVATIVKRLKAIAIAHDREEAFASEYVDGRKAGVESAIELLQSGRW